MSRFLLWVGLATVVRAQTLLLVTPLQTSSVTFIESHTEVGAETLEVEISGTVTKTLLSEPIPYTATFVEDASKYMMGETDSGLSEVCTFGADGQGSCVEQFVSQGPGGVSTLNADVLWAGGTVVYSKRRRGPSIFHSNTQRILHIAIPD
ncbi:hypothetical protein MVEN_00744000 [Mycena venus]|uniref:Uncharacterized protein n=1 Tax=Mycena venus TaxID=2733690 RepID=A0A8H6YLK6_9AGAR|nr:hypothetical protein MVEN_00744000 [Mycena venus]